MFSRTLKKKPRERRTKDALAALTHQRAEWCHVCTQGETIIRHPLSRAAFNLPVEIHYSQFPLRPLSVWHHQEPQNQPTLYHLGTWKGSRRKKLQHYYTGCPKKNDTLTSYNFWINYSNPKFKRGCHLNLEHSAANRVRRFERFWIHSVWVHLDGGIFKFVLHNCSYLQTYWIELNAFSAQCSKLLVHYITLSNSV